MDAGHHATSPGSSAPSVQAASDQSGLAYPYVRIPPEQSQKSLPRGNHRGCRGQGSLSSKLHVNFIAGGSSQEFLAWGDACHTSDAVMPPSRAVTPYTVLSGSKKKPLRHTENGGRCSTGEATGQRNYRLYYHAGLSRMRDRRDLLPNDDCHGATPQRRPPVSLRPPDQNRFTTHTRHSTRTPSCHTCSPGNAA